MDETVKDKPLQYCPRGHLLGNDEGTFIVFRQKVLYKKVYICLFCLAEWLERMFPVK